MTDVKKSMLDGTCLDENYYTECQSNQAGVILIKYNASLIMILIFIKECKFKI